MTRLPRGRLVARLIALVLASAFLLAPRAEAQELFDIPSVTISGGELARSVELAPADADAFRRRVNQLPRLEDAPAVEGPVYRVTTSYWPLAVRLEKDEDVLDVAVQGDYYPQGGFVRLSVDGEDAWGVVNLRQRAILDRYIRLAEAGLIDEAPSTLAMLVAAADEAFGIAAGGEALDFEAGVALLTLLAEANPEPQLDPREPPVDIDEGYWLEVTLLEGRTLRYFYDGQSLTESLGTERYDASSAVETLAAITPAHAPPIEEQDSPGSLLWWPVMVGGGLIAIGIAVWLRRRALAI